MVLMCEISSAWMFTVFGLSKKIIAGDENARLTFGQLVQVGLLTGFAESFITGPIELVKTEMQVSFFKRKSTKEVVSYLFRNYGIKSFYRGFVPTLLRNTPGDAVYFGTYEFLKWPLKEYLGYYPGTMLAGGLSGLCFWTTMYPLDVIKSRMQLDQTKRYTSVLSTFRSILKNEGWKALWNGYPVVAVRTLLISGTGFLTYEHTKKLVLSLRH
eukprot:TRINITY_DN1232_c0_g1_i3.p1 TRINITY_DN1232_c0_g1~~TRINITY_DN1232_c0_g1_i3.p1  ORF type:complete len:213 (-),score=22.00 TRINITY_DN1232_c0_g1_i3:122-760(-)